MADFTASDSATPLPPAITSNSRSQFVVIWGKDNGSALMGALFDLTGTPTSREFLVFKSSDRVCNLVSAAHMAGEQAGFAVAWVNSSLGSAPTVMTRRFNRDGTPFGPAMQTNAIAPERGFGPSLARAGDANAIVCWPAEDGSIRAMMFDSAGAPRGGEIKISPDSGFHSGPVRVAALSSNGFAVCWVGGDLPGSNNVMFQLLQPTGEKIGDIRTLDISRFGGAMAVVPIVESDFRAEGGHFAVITTNQPLETGQVTLEGMVFDQRGATLTGPFSITQRDRNTFVTQVAAVPMPNHQFLVTWCEHPSPDFGDVSDTNIKAMLCNEDQGPLVEPPGGDLSALLPAIDVNPETVGAQSSPATTFVFDGDTGEAAPIIVWMDDLGDPHAPTRFIRGRVLGSPDLQV